MSYFGFSRLVSRNRFGLHFRTSRRWNLDKQHFAALGLVLLLTFVAYSRSLLGGFVFDDYPQIVLNQPLRHWSFAWFSWTRDLWWYIGRSSHPHSAYYRPIQNTFLAIIFPIAGTSALRWHILNILLHLVVVTLTFRLSRLLTANTAASLLAALLFGVLTIHAESIVWISAFHEPLTAIFELGAFCTFIDRPRGRLSGLFLPVLLFTFAAFAHESAVAFPLLIAAYTFLLEPDGRTTRSEDDPRSKLSCTPSHFRRAFLLGLPFAAIDLLYMSARLFSLGIGAFLGVSHKAVHFHRIGNQIVIRTNVVNPPTLRILNTLPLVITTYLEVFVLPWLAGPAHPVRFLIVRTLESFYQPLLLLLSLASVCYFVLRNNAHWRLYCFCALWWLMATLPALNLNQVVSPVQDRYQYIPSVGVCIWVAHLSITLASNGACWKKAIAFCLAGFIALQTFALWRIESVWHDNLTMFAKCVDILPDSVFYREQLAAVLRNRGDLAGAAKQLTIAADSDPEDYMIHSQLGDLYIQMGQNADADREFRDYLRSIAPWSVGGGSEQSHRQIPHH